MIFQSFSTSHLITLLIGGLMWLALTLSAKYKKPSPSLAWAIILILNLITQPLNLWAWHTSGLPLSLENTLPLQLCDMANFTAIIALLTRHRIACFLTYFWGLAATTQAVITPALSLDFPSPIFISFFVHHFAVIFAALFIPLHMNWRPHVSFQKAPWLAVLYSNIYLVIIYGINRILGTNYAFVIHKPTQGGIMDLLGPWPFYLLAIQAMGIILFYLLALPWKKQKTA